MVHLIMPLSLALSVDLPVLDSSLNIYALREDAIHSTKPLMLILFWKYDLQCWKNSLG